MPFGKISLVKYFYMIDTCCLLYYNSDTEQFGVFMDEFWNGFWIGVLCWVLFSWAIQKLMIKMITHLVVKQIKEQQQTEEVLLTLEKHGNVLYCYRKDDNQFVGQAESIEEICNIFTKRFPKQNAKILKEDSAGLL